MTRDPTTNKIFIGEVGEADIEEIDLLAGATNYGWPQAEGTLPLGTAGQNGDTLPIYQYSHFADPNIGGAITGVAVSPAGFGDLGGRLFFCDFNSHKIYHLPLDPTHTTVTGELTLFAKGMLGPTDLWFGPASPGSSEPALFYVEYAGGAVRRITQPAPDPYTYDPLGGKKIVVRMKPNKWLSVQSTGETDIGDSNGSPLVDGGSVRVTATGIDATYPLPAARWKPVLKSGAIVGYNYKDHKRSPGRSGAST